MIRLLIVAAMLAASTLALTACGKVGPNTPPGPSDKIIYPRLPYPAQ